MLKVFPNNYDTLKVLGSLYAHSEPADQKEKETRRQKAKEVLKKVVDMFPDDIEALIDYAQLIENSNPQVNLMFYSKSFLRIDNLPRHFLHSEVLLIFCLCLFLRN